MTETKLPPIVRGEIQPWTDRDATGGPVLAAFLADLLPASAGRVLVAGPHDAGVLDVVAGRSDDVTVLLRSVSDAEALRGGAFSVVTGALDGLADEKPVPFDVVIAADGLDRLLGPDSPALDWPERADLLRGLAAPDGLVVIGLANDFAITALLDRRPEKERHGDDEWRPLHDDPRRPSSPAQVEALLGGVARRYSLFATAGRVHTLLDSGALSRTRAGLPGSGIALAGLAAVAGGTPLLAPVTDAAEAAARAGMLDAVAPGWLIVLGQGGTTRTAYTPAGTADLEGGGWRFGDRLVPDVESAETVLFRLAAAEDVPGFRAYAARLTGGAYFDAVHDFEKTPGDEVPLAAAWHRFRDRLIGGHRRHPWPPWMAEGDDLVKTWLAMSGIEPTAEILAHGREIAGPAPEPDDLRTVLADAETARRTAEERAGHIFGLERTIGFRDRQLRTREQQLRDMRAELRLLKSGRAVRMVSLVGRVARLRDPKRLAGAVKRRARRFLPGRS
ncbi:hypothetical protein Ait01nite_063450 [Actinoplanes italicus]|uniref:Uncharacterized protein n=1 Tax=Actinoplanes italicus TaxID=113567 RepID=A0A2T0K4S9_9ACTN|nr:hypothetical protein [Actinoplanes italicus]PRX17919.1 hypothetical protein CLV67_11488 [Actinoplanes italicus]GIE33300.1 hypothetical protein Ait01nite_063450 [Actinoplanes italicus]